jgi:hypothetical protein
MSEINKSSQNQPAQTTGQPIADWVKSVLMALLTIVFLALYIGALFGLIPGPNHPDLPTLGRIESIIFVIIGYYFGRLPSQANEAVLKSEIDRHADKTDQAEKDKSVALQDKAAFQQKMHSAVALLRAPRQASVIALNRPEETGPELPDSSAAAALRVLTS